MLFLELALYLFTSKMGGVGSNVQGKESKLASRDAILVNESARKVASEDGSEIILRHLIIHCQ